MLRYNWGDFLMRHRQTTSSRSWKGEQQRRLSGQSSIVSRLEFIIHGESWSWPGTMQMHCKPSPICKRHLQRGLGAGKTRAPGVHAESPWCNEDVLKLTYKCTAKFKGGGHLRRVQNRWVPLGAFLRFKMRNMEHNWCPVNEAFSSRH